MTVPVIEPLAEVEGGPLLAGLPKADLHVHQEAKARLDRVLARRQGHPSYDWRGWTRRLLTERPPGMGRLAGFYEPEVTLGLDVSSDANAEDFIARVADVLEEGAADGAILIEVRVGAAQAPPLADLMPLFREAERRVRVRYPHLHAEAIGYLGLIDDPERLRGAERHLEGYLQAAPAGLAGLDLRIDPYDTEANPALWQIAYRWAARAAEAGLGITVHAGEFSSANLAAALRVPGLGRLGHAVYAAHDPRLLEEVARSGVTIECSLTCNVVLGAVLAYETHPIRRFVEHGIPIVLGTDNPVHICTTIGREYAVAAALGCSVDDLLTFTRTAVRASFTSAARRAALLHELDLWGKAHVDA